MSIGREDFIEILKDSYSAYYTILPEETAGDLPLAFRARYGARDESYFFVKSANIWGNEKNEYAYVFAAPSFDAALAERCMDWAIEDMLPRVKPHKEHQYTNAKVIFVADSLDEDTIKAVKKKRFSKSYGPLSLHGYTELLAAAVDLSESRACTNKAGYQLADYFKKLFAAREEKTGGNLLK